MTAVRGPGLALGVARLRCAGLAVVAAALLTACGGSSSSDVELQAGVQHGPYDVVRVVDGDTIRVDRDGEEIVVRLIGINTPETVAPNRPVECFGPEASARTKELVEGKRVWLEYDEVSGLTDKYDRTLAYVWVSPEVMLNEELVREGFAEQYVYSEGARFEAEIGVAEREAQSVAAGLWSACPPASCAPPAAPKVRAPVRPWPTRPHDRRCAYASSSGSYSLDSKRRRDARRATRCSSPAA